LIKITLGHEIGCGRFYSILCSAIRQESDEIELKSYPILFAGLE